MHQNWQTYGKSITQREIYKKGFFKAKKTHTSEQSTNVKNSHDDLGDKLF
jgi:hypothetical protein